MQITLEIPDKLEQPLQQFRDRLPEVLERGLRELTAEESLRFQDADAILEFLVSQPTPEQVLAMKPSSEFQARVSELLDKNKTDGLTRQEETQLDRYLMIEHMTRLAKAHAYQQLEA
ncbi:MAG: hypothetical protein HY327_02585 [Chloroflexi bacterium]|nr:hypothetical protein [Chloroflexota bacterium]